MKKKKDCCSDLGAYINELLKRAKLKNEYVFETLGMGCLLYTSAVYGYAVSDFSWIYLSLSRYSVCSLVISGGCISSIGYRIHIAVSYTHL